MSMKEWSGSNGPAVALRAVVPRPTASGYVSATAVLKTVPLALRLPATPADQSEGGRTKIWQLAAALHCSIVGTCLTTGELKALLRKFNAGTAEATTDHELHGIAVAAVGTRTPLAKQIQKALDRRHGAAVRRFAKAASADEVQGLWDDAKRSGDIPGAYWAVLTHPAASDALVRRVFGDVHMLSHLIGAANRADIRRLHQLERERDALEEKLARQQIHLKEGIVARDEKIRSLTMMLGAQMEQARPAATDASSETATLRELVVDLRKRLEAESARRSRAENRSGELAASRGEEERRRLSLEREVDELRRELDAAEAGIAALSRQEDEAEPALDLAGLTVLYVGGRPHLVARLKVLIERASGRFIHHDGGVEERRDMLAGLVSRADIALFPVDCISHDAAQAVKRLCQQSGKLFVPLRSSSAASLLSAVRSLGLSREATS